MPESIQNKSFETTPSPLKEGVHFYFNEDGLLVFTETYHRQRGSCCKNCCKHCPWNFRG